MKGDEEEIDLSCLKQMWTMTLFPTAGWKSEEG